MCFNQYLLSAHTNRPFCEWTRFPSAIRRAKIRLAGHQLTPADSCFVSAETACDATAGDKPPHWQAARPRRPLDLSAVGITGRHRCNRTPTQNTVQLHAKHWVPLQWWGETFPSGLLQESTFFPLQVWNNKAKKNIYQFPKSQRTQPSGWKEQSKYWRFVQANIHFSNV